MYFVPGCCNCGSGCGPAVVNSDTSCGGGAAITGGTFDLRDAADTTTLATQTGSSASFTGLDGTLSYKVRWSKTGYHTKTSSTVTPGCGGTSYAGLSSWPTTYSRTWHLYLHDGMGDCPHAGVTVAVTGDATASGSTDSSGNVTLTLSSTSTSVTQSLNYSLTPTSGRGVASESGSFTTSACTATATYNDQLNPSTGHAPVVCNNKYMPEDLTATDDFGSCTVSYDSGSGSELPTWYGSYTYESTNCIDDHECTPPFILPAPDKTADVTVSLYLFRITADSDCVDSVWDVGRGVCAGTAGACFAISGTTAVKCQPVADAIAGGSSFPDCTLPPGANLEGLDQTYSCSSSVSIDFTIDTKVISSVSCEETGVDVNFSGTIT